MKYRVCRQDDNRHVFTVSHDGIWFANLAQAEAVKRALAERSHKQDYWIEDEDGREVSAE